MQIYKQGRRKYDMIRNKKKKKGKSPRNKHKQDQVTKFGKTDYLDLEKAEEPEIKLSTSIGSSKKQDTSRKTSTSALLTMPKPLTVWITTNWKILKEMGIPNP